MGFTRGSGIGREELNVERAIDGLIAVARRLLEGKWDVAVFEKWRLKALDCLRALFWPDHTYTLYFSDFVRQADRIDVLTGAGLLVAAREQVGRTCVGV